MGTPETSEAPVAVEAVGVEGAEKKEEVAEPVKVEEAKKPSGISLPMTEANDDWMDDDVGLTMDDSDEEEDVKVEAEVPNSEDNKAKESIVSDTTEEKKEEAGSEQENTTTTCLTSESNSTEKDIEDANKKTAKTVAGILTRVKEDTEMTDMEKIDTLCLLLSKFVEENGVLKNEVGIMLEQIKKHNAAKETLKAMNAAYKKQVDLVKELETERGTNANLERTVHVTNLREQLDIY